MILDLFTYQIEVMLKNIRCQIPRRPHVEFETLLRENISPPAQIRVLLDHGHIVTLPRKKPRRPKPANPATDDY